MSEDVRKVVAEFAARDSSGAVFAGIERKLSNFQKAAGSFAKIGRMAGFTYLIGQLDDVAASLQKASYHGENIGYALLRSLPVVKQIDEVTRNIAKSFADIATGGQITSNTLLENAQDKYKKLFEEMKRNTDLAAAGPEEAARLKVENAYQDRIKAIKEWDAANQELIKHNELLKKQIQELEKLKKQPMGRTVNVGSMLGTTPVREGRQKTNAQIDKEISALQDQILTYDLARQKNNLLLAAEQGRTASLGKLKEQNNYNKLASERAEITARMYEDMGIKDKRYRDAQVALLDIQKTDYSEFITDKALLDDWYAKRKEDLDKNALEKWADTYSNMGNVWDGLAEDSAQGLDSLASAMTNFYKTGEMGWNSWLESLYTSYLDTINKMIVANIAKGALNPLMNALGSGLSNIFAGGTGGTGATVPYTEAAGVHVYHRGGKVGFDYVPMRSVPASLFADAPRLHDGLKSNEQAAILEIGEVVTSKEDVRRGRNKGSTIINFNITTPDADSFRRSKTQIMNDFKRVSR